MQNILAILYGMVFGVANIIPGVSGGTMLVTFGCYDKVCGALSLNLREMKKNAKFLVFFGLGAVVGIVGFSFIITYLFENFPVPTYTFFMGLILGSVPLIVRNATHKEKFRPICLVPFVLALSLVVGLTVLENLNPEQTPVEISASTVTFTNNSAQDMKSWSLELTEGEITAVSDNVRLEFVGGKTEMIKDWLGIEYDTTPRTILPPEDNTVLRSGESISFTYEGENVGFKAGYEYSMSVVFFITLLLASLVAAVAMIIPGVSGSFMMVLMGTYTTVISAVKDFNFIVLLPALIGIVIGLVFGARLITFLMKKFRLIVFSAILGLVIGSLYAILPGGLGFNAETLIGVLTLLVGGFVSFIVGKNTKVED